MNRVADADLLLQVPLLAGLPEALRARVAASATRVQLDAGQWLFREGEPGDAAYIVRSGRLDVVTEGEKPTVIRTVKRGAVLGELALLRGDTRSASAIARRSSELVGLGRAEFDEILSSDPAFAIGLARMLAAQLSTHRAAATSEEPPRTIAVLALDDGVSAADLARRLEAGLAHEGTVATLGADGEPLADHLPSLAHAERHHDHVVMAADAEGDAAWTAACIADSDLIIAAGSRPPAARWAAGMPIAGCELLVLGGRVLAPSIGASVGARDVQCVEGDAALNAAIEMTARRVCGRSIGLVLSGGGARAFAHIGVLEALTEAGVQVDRIGGVSFGAIVGCALALGRDAAEIASTFHTTLTESNPTNDWTLPAYSLIRGVKTERMLEGFFGDARFEALPRRFFCVSTDLNTRSLVVHRSGLVRDALRASVSLPGIFPPVPTRDGKLLVDGGVLDNLPVATMAAAGEGPVIAVDVTGVGVGEHQRPSPSPWARRVRRTITGTEVELPGIVDTMFRTLTAGSIDTIVAGRQHADLVITPRVDGVGLLDWKQIQRARAAGRTAVEALLADRPDALEPFRTLTPPDRAT